MIITALVFGVLAALLHVYIFLMESMWWTTPRARATFGTTEAEAKATKELAFNQGFYNLFLGIAVALGVVFHPPAHRGRFHVASRHRTAHVQPV